MKRILSLVLIVSLLTAPLSLAAIAEDSQSERVLNWFAAGEVTTMDTAKSYDTVSGQAQSLFSDPLYRTLAGNIVVPNLATELPTASEDGLTLSVTIRDDAYYSNGEKIVAADIVYAAQRVVDPETGSQSAKSLDFLLNADEIIAGEKDPSELGVKAISDTELEFQLAAPSPFVNDQLATGLLSPVKQSFVEEQGDAYALTADAIIYPGPFSLTDWNGTDVEWSYVKNPYYWDADNVYFDEIHFTVVKEVSTGINLYDAGQLDAVAISGDYVPLYRGTDDLLTVQSLRMTNLELGISSNEFLQNENLRHALSYAIDRDELANAILNGDAIPAVGVIPNGIAVNPETGASIAEDFGTLVYTDKEKALEYWNTALSELGTDTVTLRLVTSDTDEQIKVGQYLQSALQNALPGLVIDLANVPSSVRFDEMMSYDFDLALGGWTGDYDPTSYVKQFETSYEHNHGQWVSDELTELVNALEKTDGNDALLRWEHLKEANQYLVDNAVVVNLVQAANSFLINPKLKGYTTTEFSSYPNIRYAYFDD
ncbi:MAG: peptide ABC transporter substrate-binding protein [Clostridia bacterium]|nr:peptide ABC transporter substrate-binding protein [Clostridia bacterium]